MLHFALLDPLPFAHWIVPSLVGHLPSCDFVKFRVTPIPFDRLCGSALTDCGTKEFANSLDNPTTFLFVTVTEPHNLSKGMGSNPEFTKSHEEDGQQVMGTIPVSERSGPGRAKMSIRIWGPCMAVTARATNQ